MMMSLIMRTLYLTITIKELIKALTPNSRIIIMKTKRLMKPRQLLKVKHRNILNSMKKKDHKPLENHYIKGI